MSVSYTSTISMRSLPVAGFDMNPMSIGSPLSGSCGASSPSSPSSQMLPQGPELTILQNCVRQLFLTTDRSAEAAERLPGDVHINYLLHMSDGAACIMKSGPGISTRTLRSEQSRLDNESRILLTIARNTNFPVPQHIKFSSRSCSQAIRAPYLIRSYIPGRRLSDVQLSLTPTGKAHIDQSLGVCFRALSSLTANAFGSPHAVRNNNGRRSWREAFLGMFEAILRDGEDMLVSIPYDVVRYHVTSRAQALDAITTPRLTALGACLPEKVLVNEESMQITGLLGFGNVIWGDPEMAAVFAAPSDAFLQGCERVELAEDMGERRTRLLM
jgi:hypothetical protein